MLKNVLTLVVGMGTVWILYRLNLFRVGWMLLPFLFALLMSGWFIGFSSAALIVYFGRRLQGLAWMLGFLLAPFSAVYYPVDALPVWAQKVSFCLPMTYVFDGMRQILREGPTPWLALGMALGLNVLYLAASVAFFAWMFEKSRNRGLARMD